MVRCAVLNCNNNNKKTKRNEPKTVRYFRFPKDENKHGKWLKFCGNRLININNARICSDHFVDEDYRLQDVLLKADICKRRLKRDAVPSKNVPSISEPSPKAEKMIKREIVHVKYEEIPELFEIDTSNKNNILAIDEPRKTKDVATQARGNVESSLKKEIEDLKKRLRSKTNECVVLKKLLQQETEFNKNVKNLFSKAQLQKLKNPQNKVNWSSDDIINAMSLYSAGARCYSLLRTRGLPLPSVSTLQKWIAKLRKDAGALTKSS